MKEFDCEKEKNSFWSLKCCIDNCENCNKKINMQSFNNLKVEETYHIANLK